MKTRRKKDSTMLMTCKGGPYDGHGVRLSGDAIRQTAQFTAKGLTGSYRHREGTTITQWVPA
jgi:hypothetical protein